MTKLAKAPEGVQPATWDTFDPARPQGWVLPVEYWMVGELTSPPLVGEKVRIIRYVRNGVICLGNYVSTRITQVVGDLETDSDIIFTTQNSIYRIEPILNPDQVESLPVDLPRMKEEKLAALRREAFDTKQVIVRVYEGIGLSVEPNGVITALWEQGREGSLRPQDQKTESHEAPKAAE